MFVNQAYPISGKTFCLQKIIFLIITVSYLNKTLKGACMRVKIRVLGIGPKNVKLNKINFSKWRIYEGMTEEQEDFFKQTYVDYIIKPGKVKQKHIYFCQN
jgi:hypothetical protein